MKLILLGNAGAGKTSLTRQLLNILPEPMPVLSLDTVAFIEQTAERRPLAESVEAIHTFMHAQDHAQDHWLLEGCYAEMIDAIADKADRLIFLNPGSDTCVTHCRNRPWEPSKFPTPEAQQTHLQALIDWVQQYDSRTDEYGLAAHRATFERFAGEKWELNDPSCYADTLVSGNFPTQKP